MDPEKCLDDAELRSIIDSVGAASQQSRYEEHIGSCDDCIRRLEAISGSIPQQLTMSEIPASSEALSDIMAGLRRLEPSTRRDIAKTQTVVERTDVTFPYLAPSDREEYLGRLAKYEVITLLGRGGMGVVFAAFDPVLNREVAIKVPSASIVATREAHDRFMREARAIAAVKHHNIVTVYAAEEENGTLFLVMELVHGESLADRLRATPRLSWQEVVKIGQEVAAALEAAHEVGVVHRDITPANILLEKNTGRVKVSDFGLAKSAMDVSLTATGVLAGTPEYMSPEQAAEGTVRAASDMFSLGTVLYQACAGNSPFQAASVLSTLRRVCEARPQPLHELDRAVPVWFSNVVQRLLAKDPLNRPRSAQTREMLLNEGRIEEVPISGGSDRLNLTTRSRRRAVFTLIALASMILLAAYFAVRTLSRGRQSFFVASSGIAFRDLGDAIDAVSDGDSINVRGDGPFQVEGFSLGSKRITIRATAGSRPRFVNARANPDRPFLDSEADLTLEGIEVQWASTAQAAVNRLDEFATGGVISVAGANVTLTHCRLTAASESACLSCQRGSVTLAGSHLVSQQAACMVWIPEGDEQLMASHCVFEGQQSGILVSGTARRRDVPSGNVSLQNNSFAVRVALNLIMKMPMRSFDVICERNAFDTAVILLVTPGSTAPRANFPAPMQKRLVFSKLDWTDLQNGYRKGAHFMERGRPDDDRYELVLEPSLDGWLASCANQESGSFETDFRPRDAHLGPDSFPPDPLANIRFAAGTSSAEIGADLSRVGPGAQTQFDER